MQVLVFAVDKAWLLLQPYELPDVEHLFVADFAPDLATVTSSSSPLNPDALTLWSLVCASWHWAIQPFSCLLVTLSTLLCIMARHHVTN
jgi:hypothetical protein